ncbi:trimeric intracellular cation channel family protein [Gordonia sp. HNM0687]|uniref:Trimeric intracellular cation channel family protein n=1 Tax=Gordonia mangrovi TaxID=2665643 RepID=A0A6L7GSH8_9ACTN|nr:trimeric intracellular cation channel family protein [Gordonia mangrovi]MXP22830.1 trimeric intracellular cation channel family protein [Gordonia mangrovi]UVF77140.1 trimeric intracellular cation channel family protein [Gordonia mangrovi]
MLQEILNDVGIAVFAASGALLGVRKDFDLWGIVTVGALTGVGGGILRDVMLGITPPSSIENWLPIVIAAATSVVVFFFHPAFAQLRRSVLLFDAVGMGVFATSGAAIAVDHQVSAFAATLVGLLTAVGGGILRDVLANEIPLLLQPADLYAVPALLGAAVVALGGGQTSVPIWIWLVAGTIVATGLRVLGLIFGWRLPTAPAGVRRRRREA